jgi:hypothetical protein
MHRTGGGIVEVVGSFTSEQLEIITIATGA